MKKTKRPASDDDAADGDGADADGAGAEPAPKKPRKSSAEAQAKKEAKEAAKLEKEQDPLKDLPKKGRSSYIIFCADKRDGIEGSMTEKTKLMASMWNDLSVEDKAVYLAKADAEKEEKEKEREAFLNDNPEAKAVWDAAEALKEEAAASKKRSRKSEAALGEDGQPKLPKEPKVVKPPKVLTEEDKVNIVNRMTEKLKRLLDGSDDPACPKSPKAGKEAMRAATVEPDAAPMDDGAGDGSSADKKRRTQTFHPDTKLVILSAEAKAEIMHVLDKLAKFPMTVELLRKTIIAKQLQEMKKHPEADLPLVVKPIVKAWKAMFKE